jgi:hypothetical protein
MTEGTLGVVCMQMKQIAFVSVCVTGLALGAVASAFLHSEIGEPVSLQKTASALSACASRAKGVTNLLDWTLTTRMDLPRALRLIR